MTDTLSAFERSARMAMIRHRDTQPEMLVRTMAHRLGFRFRLHDKRLPGTPDLVFPRLRKVVFVHGCFWHRHSDPTCKLARMPKSKLDFWEPKLEANRQRDSRHQSELDELNWGWLIVWECELRHGEHLQNKLRAFLTGDDAR